MPLEEPRWWYEQRASLVPRLLSPVASLWGHLAERRFTRTEAFRAPIPVICVGNFTTGGTGKTPLAIYLAEWLKANGRAPVFLTRGYGGSRAGPHLIDAAEDTAAEVGDEALLLARSAPVMLARDRAAGAVGVLERLPGTDLIIMDDGLQNPALAKDVSIAVVDGRRGLGNRRVMPAGPLRGHLEAQLARTDVIVVARRASDAGEPSPIAEELRREFKGPVISALAAPAGDTAWLRALPVNAFCGIGAPERFFDMLRALGADVRREHRFPDHHPFTEAEAATLLSQATADGATLVTTEKDWVRLAPSAPRQRALRDAARTLPMAVSFAANDRDRLETIVLGALAKAKPRAA